MHLARIHVKNFKCFVDSGTIELARGITVVTGQNNAGKSALLSAVRDLSGNDPHRSSRAQPDVEVPVQLPTSIAFELVWEPDELPRDMARLSGMFSIAAGRS